MPASVSRWYSHAREKQPVLFMWHFGRLLPPSKSMSRSLFDVAFEPQSSAKSVSSTRYAECTL